MATYLQHVGILGMHWGRRMDKEGNVTTIKRGKRVPLMTTVRGKPVQANGSGHRKGRSSLPSSDDHKLASDLRKKKAHQLSNEELKTLTSRLQLEKSYKDLSKSDVSSGRKFVTDILLGASATVATLYVSKALKSGVELAIKAALKGK